MRVTLAQQAAEHQARDIIGEAFGPAAVHASGDGELTVSLEQATDAGTVLRVLRDHTIDVASINVQESSLGDVFLSITGETPTAAPTASTEEISV